MSYTCPKCGKISHNENDEKYGWCMACAEFTRQPVGNAFDEATGGMLVQYNDGSAKSTDDMSTTDPALDPILGDNGYPHEIELQRIRTWPMDDFRALMEYVRLRWKYADMGGWRQRGDRFRLATGGWSGNESLIGALESNWGFRALCGLSWHRGGLYFFDVREWDDNPDKGKRVQVTSPETPLDEHGFVIGCDHDE